MKKFSKKALCIILSVVIALGSLITASFAKDADGIVIKVSSDKKYYTKGEDIVLDVEVTNTTDEDMSDVDINMDCNWFNFDVEEGSSIKIKELKAGETKTIQFHAKYLRLDLFEFISVMFKRVATWFNRIILGSNSETTRYSVRVDLIKRTFVFSAEMGKVSEEEKSCTMTFDLNYEGAPVATTQSVIVGERATMPDFPKRDGYAFVGWYVDFEYSELFDFNKAINDSCTVFARWVNVEDKTDTDNDGLTDPIEAFYDTNSSLSDTDGDGLNDYVEIAVINYNPLSNDTDSNMVLDGQEDFDNDGIDNKTEIELGTDLAVMDSDGDSLDDKAEIDNYNTDPILEDTDEDGVSDGKEIELGTDPLVDQAIFNIDLSADDVEDTVTPSVKIDLSGEQVETLSIDPFEDDNFFPESMPGYMGKAYDFSVDGEFSSATISFEFDESMVDDGVEPVICYFNEENQELEELETTIVGNVASATVTHFSKYILIDRKVYKESFTWQDVWDSEQTYTDVEVVFVIDDSGSMSSNDPYYERLTVARTLIDNLPKESKIGLVRFDGDYPKTEALTPTLTTDKEVVKSFLTRTYFYSPGGTDMYNGIQKAFPLYESDAETTLKMMIVLSDGETSDTYLHSSVIATANESNIKIYTVGLGRSTSYFNNYLKPLANNTGATFYLASNAAQLADIYKDISERIDIETDSDDDGVPDYYEDNMICFNGVNLALDKNKPDTDGDGLKDGEEVELNYEYNADKTQVKVTGKLVLGNPTKVDSDDDAMDDYSDSKPLTYTITDRTLAMVQGLSYTNLESFVGYSVEEALKHVELKGISDENVKYLSHAQIVYANNSDCGYWKDFWDSGLGSVALKFNRFGANDVVIYALRGTEFKSDTANDVTADVVLGLGWDCAQSRNAFKEYRSISKTKNEDYYVTGHSLGGRLALDVLYKIYKENEDGWFVKGANIPTPVHSVTFNGLGYNGLVYATLNNGIIDKYKNKHTNFYYWSDIIGEGFGMTGVYSRPGENVRLLCKKTDGTPYRTDKELESYIYIRDWKYHGIEYFQNDYDLLLNSPHSFPYWID